MSQQALFTQTPYTSPTVVPSWFARHFPSLHFYPRLLSILFRAGTSASKRPYTGADWACDSEDVARALEAVGCHFIVEGAEHFRSQQGPFVFAANHMSTLETMVLPALIQPWHDVTFIIKKNLFSYPIFKHILHARQPIGLARKNPRDDLKVVLDEGPRKLAAGTSIIVFPQSTRYPDFDPIKFNSIAVKLAKRAEVPVVPVALYTAAWSEGSVVSDLGYIYPSIPVRFHFGEPISIAGSGKEEQAAICDFITSKLEQQLCTTR